MLKFLKNSWNWLTGREISKVAPLSEETALTHQDATMVYRAVAADMEKARKHHANPSGDTFGGQPDREGRLVFEQTHRCGVKSRVYIKNNGEGKVDLWDGQSGVKYYAAEYLGKIKYTEVEFEVRFTRR